MSRSKELNPDELWELDKRMRRKKLGLDKKNSGCMSIIVLFLVFFYFIN